jgi:hypothetical protein
MDFVMSQIQVSLAMESVMVVNITPSFVDMMAVIVKM